VLLGVGTTGLALANAPQWSQSFFTGVVLIAALAVTGMQRRQAAKGSDVKPTSMFPWVRRKEEREEREELQLALASSNGSSTKSYAKEP
jgi:hypothetical protein